MARQSTRVVAVFVTFASLLGAAIAFYLLSGPAVVGVRGPRPLAVLAYSSFINSWGPGPEIAALFEKRTGIPVEMRDAEDAGLLLRKLELFEADVVVGFDQLLLPLARDTRKWRPLPTAGVPFSQEGFLPFDWGPLALIYRDREVEPPRSLDDLLDPRFRRAVTLPDPRTSSPGLQFLFWVLEEKGLEAGFEFLSKLKPSIHSIGSSWSNAYGVFQDGQAKLALSYLTSPLYHLIHDQDDRYRAAVFQTGHPVQVEYVAVPDTCVDCDRAVEFARFLLEPEVQKIIMEKNFMLPIRDEARNGTEFEKIPAVRILEMKENEAHLHDRDALLSRWRDLGL